jgi:hypothetical protein
LPPQEAGEQYVHRKLQRSVMLSRRYVIRRPCASNRGGASGSLRGAAAAVGGGGVTGPPL